MGNEGLIQNVCRQLVEREVWCSLNRIIYALSEISHCLPSDGEISEESIRELMVAEATPQEASENEGWEVAETPIGDYVYYERGSPVPYKDVPPGKWVTQDDEGWWYGEDDDDEGGCGGPYASHADALEALWVAEYIDTYSDEEEAWEACVDNERIDVHEHDREVYEHYAVSNFLGARLERVGEKVVGFCGFDVWCRTCTGQSTYMDYCIRQVASDMHILPGQENDWSRSD